MYKNAAVEDHELSFRIYDRGLKMVLKRDALVSHEHPTSVTDYMKRKFNVAFWKYLVLKSHPDKIKSDSNTPQILKIQIALGGIFLISLVLSFISVFINIPVSLLLSSLGFFFLFLHIALSCPFYKESLKYDRKVALIIPFMDLVRSISFFIGFSSSLFKMLLVRKR